MQNSTPFSILIVGLGNPILGDDGVGWQVAESLTNWLSNSSEITQKNLIEIETLSLGGLSLMEHLIDHTHVVIVDAVNTGQNPVGSIMRCRLEDLPMRVGSHLSSAHDTSLQNALLIGRKMGANLPGEIIIIGIEASSVYDFSEQLTEPVAAAVSQAKQHVIDQILEWTHHADIDL
jgi:hydrogenase maturation protease